jgi:hypothetical protein
LSLPFLLQPVPTLPPGLPDHLPCRTGRYDSCCGGSLPALIRSRGPYRVQMNIPAQLSKVAVPVDDDRLVSALKQMAAPISLYVDVSGVGAVQVMHHLTKVRFGGFDEEVVMVGHENIAVKNDAVFFFGLFEIGEKFLVVSIGKEDTGAFVVRRGAKMKHLLTIAVPSN